MDVGPCNFGNSQRTVKVKAIITSPTGAPLSSVDLQVDGSTVDSGSGPSPLSLSSTDTYSATQTGQHTVTVKVPGCPDTTTTFCIGECEPPNCLFRHWFVLVSGALAGFLWMLYACDPNTPHMIAAVVATIGFIVAIFAWVPCQSSCGWLMIGWQIPLLTALTLLVMSNCCTLLFWIVAFGLLLVTSLFFQWWRANCCPTDCDILLQLLVVMFLFAADVLVLLGVITNLWGTCGVGWVAIVVGLLATWLFEQYITHCP